MLIDYLICNFKELLEKIIQQKIIEILFHIIMYRMSGVNIKYFNVLIDGKSLFDSPVKNEEEAYEKIIEMRRNNDYTTGNLLDFVYFLKNDKLIAIDLRKETKLKDPQQISFTDKLLATRGATMFFITEKSEETTFNFSQNSVTIIWILETQKIVTLLNGSENENSKFATKKWYVIESESKGNYSHHDPITFLTKSIESSLCDYSDAYILVTGNIAVKRRNAADTADIALGAITQVAFKNCVLFEKCSTEIDGTLVDEANFINITMPMYNLIEYSDNYSDTSGSLWGFKRDEIDDNADVTNDYNAPSFKYKASNIGNTENNGTKNGIKIAVPLKYLINFWRSLEMPLINWKVELSLKWIENCVLNKAANANNATFKITDAKMYVPIVNLSGEANAKFYQNY